MKYSDKEIKELAEFAVDTYGGLDRGCYKSGYIDGFKKGCLMSTEKAYNWWLLNFASICIEKENYEYWLSKIKEFREYMEE